MKTHFCKWYEKNKTSFSARRKDRYRTDEVYRAKALENANNRRERLRLLRKNSLPTEYTYGFLDVSEYTFIPSYIIRAWILKRWIPKPFINAKKFYFTQKQADLLVDFYTEITKLGRFSKKTEPLFNELIKKIKREWSI